MIDLNKNNEPLDLSYLREMSGDSIEFMIEMLDAFKEQTPIYMQNLALAVEARDWKSVYECAHKIKPTFFYVGRADARDFMQTIEQNARELIDVDDIPSYYIQLEQFVTNLYRQLDDAKLLLQQKL